MKELFKVWNAQKAGGEVDCRFEFETFQLQEFRVLIC